MCQPEVEFLGHIVSAKGVTGAAVLGSRNYITADLFTISPRLQNPFITCLMEETALFQWSTQCQDAFENLKHRLVSASILTCSALDTDASDSGIGAVFLKYKRTAQSM